MVNFTSWLHYPLDRTVVPVEQETGWVAELNWLIYKRAKSLAPARIRISYCPVHSIVTITKLLWLLI
jgi:hypothetical protein